MRRSRSRRRLVAATVALLAVATGAATGLPADGSDNQRSMTRTAAAPPRARTPPHPRSPTPATPATASPQPAAVQTRAHRFLTGYLALPHGRGSIRALRHVAVRGLLRELRRNRPRVTPMQQRTRTRTVHLHTALPSPGSARAGATLKDRGGPPYLLQLYLERHGTRGVVTHIGDA
jgi:hypothetical protein